MFAQREGIVRAQHHALGSHSSHQKLQSALVEYRRIYIEAIQIVAGRQLTNAVRHRMMLPRILQSPQQEREASPAVREANFQILRQLVERSVQNHRDDTELRLDRKSVV